MVILHVICVKNSLSNGVVNAVTNYTFYESKYCQAAIFNIGSNIDEACNYDLTVFSNNTFNSISSLPEPFNKPDLVVFNEVYKYKYIQLYKECFYKGIPYIVIPHGCLVKEAQNHKKIKKTIANILLFNKFLKNAKAIQYLNNSEKNKSVIFNERYFISGNGIDVCREKNKFKNKNFVFIGRYDIKVKGLDLLVKTVTNNQKWFLDNDIKIQLYGRNSGNGYEKLKLLITKNRLSNIIIINPPVYNNQKKEILLNSYAFVQISRHEGQPMGIMEALSYGIPCIVTYGTSFGDYVNNNKCGIGIDFKEEELFHAIKKMYNDEYFRNCCSKNTSIVEKEFEWKIVIRKVLEEYKKIINNGRR